MATLKGRRRRSAEGTGKFPRGIRAGDYWRAINSETGEPLTVDEPGNLTGSVWWVAAPMGSGGFGLGRLTKHTVREESDGTISVRPGDGSSNSILMTGANGQFHGYIEHGVWSDV
jgi:hypothetical protein